MTHLYAVVVTVWPPPAIVSFRAQIFALYRIQRLNWKKINKNSE